VEHALTLDLAELVRACVRARARVFVCASENYWSHFKTYYRK